MTDDAETHLPPEVAEHLPMHPVEFGILLVLTDGVRHGYDIIQAVPERIPPVRDLHSANLYRRIRRMRQRGLIDDAEPVRAVADDDRERKFFRITALGLAVARAEATRLRSMVAEVNRNPALEGGAG